MQTEKCERTDQDLAGQHAPEVSTQSNAGDSCENKYNADGGTSQVDQHGDGSLPSPCKMLHSVLARNKNGQIQLKVRT